jgi:hypothetical protein
VLLKTQTPWGGSGNNRLFSLDLENGSTQTLLEASADDEGNGKGLVFGGVACSPGCSDVCFMADADARVMQRIFFEENGSLSVGKSVLVEDKVGLPPVSLSAR